MESQDERNQQWRSMLNANEVRRHQQVKKQINTWRDGMKDSQETRELNNQLSWALTEPTARNELWNWLIDWLVNMLRRIPYKQVSMNQQRRQLITKREWWTDDQTEDRDQVKSLDRLTKHMNRKTPWSTNDTYKQPVTPFVWNQESRGICCSWPRYWTPNVKLCSLSSTVWVNYLLMMMNVRQHNRMYQRLDSIIGWMSTEHSHDREVFE